MSRKASDYETDEDDASDIVGIHKLVLDQSLIPSGRHLFQLAESPVVIASEVLVKKWVAAQVYGVKFVKPADYSSVSRAGVRHRPEQ